MRFIAIAAVLLSFPLLMQLLRSDPRWRKWAYFGLGLLPFTVAAWNLDAGLVNWATWAGFAKGYVLTLEDTLALAIIMTHPRPKGAPPLIGWLYLFMVTVSLSIPGATMPMAASFYVFQLARVALVFAAVAKIAGDPKALMWLGLGLASAMTLEAGVCLYQRFHGAFRAAGTMSHPNQLGMMAHFVVLPLLGMILSGYRSKIMMLGIASGLVVIVLGASRATMGFLGTGMVLTMLLSLRRGATPKKMQMVGLAAAALVVATPFLLHSVGQRLAQQLESQSDYDERAAFERAAKMMWAEHPLGVGATNYVLVANTQGYSARAGVVWNSGSRAANVHNTYLLTAAELGWPGIIAYVLMLATSIVAGWRWSFASRRDPRGDITLGCTVALMMMALHSQYEWITVTYEVQYTIAIAMGIISGLTRQRKLEQRQARELRRAGLSQAELESVGSGQPVGAGQPVPVS
ncbi:O-antigen ligase family protein [Novosphingobium piscinae]|uniref:O-antigen ligase family protein n=1 Tax=Novosphingobium piscinae TaxID=1507448 RepID=A0A7X1FWB6_9SPHN|nr:O-antigen ligase family protein [Novosphingobium piscinae]MBC2668131.1 O-antigen ligase family protein [Novosphingobium piscinae]